MMPAPLMKLDTKLNDTLRGKLDLSIAQNLELQSRTRHLALKFCTQGTEVYRAMGKTHRVQKNQVLVLPKNEAFEFLCAKNERTTGICIDLADPFFERAVGCDEFLPAAAKPQTLYGLTLNPSSSVYVKRLIGLMHTIQQQNQNASRYDDWLTEAAGLLLNLHLEVKGE